MNLKTWCLQIWEVNTLSSLQYKHIIVDKNQSIPYFPPHCGIQYGIPSKGMTDDSPHLQTRPKYTNLPHCKVAISMQTCPKYILAPLFRVMHYEWAAWKKEVCFSNQFKLLNFSALHVLPCEPCSVTWREGSAVLSEKDCLCPVIKIVHKYLMPQNFGNIPFHFPTIQKH